jgi:hypothetical protein
VAAAAVYLTHGVAGIGWVGTLSAHRGHRYAEAVTWAAVREGFRRGAPGALPRRIDALLDDLALFVLPERRARRYPRAVKLKISRYRRKRPAPLGSRAK